MRVFTAIILALTTMTIIEAGIEFALPLLWFSHLDAPVPPDEKADYLAALLQSPWLLSAASAISGFIGTRIFAGVGHISRFTHIALFAGVIATGWLLEAGSYGTGAMVATTGLACSLLGGYLGLRKTPEPAHESATPETGDS